MKKTLLPITLIGVIILSACTPAEQSPRGFSLPEGDAAVGKTTYVELQCNSCHSSPDVEQDTASQSKISVALGGQVGRVKTYADLVTSIINPSHKLAPGYPAKKIGLGLESRMRNYNDAMTVTQLVDVVSYLQPHYEVRAYEPTMYRGYHP